MNRIAIVTGASRTKGMGRTICLELARQGFDIFFTYWREYDDQMPWGVEENEPEIIQQEICDLGVRCEKLELDLTDDVAIDVLYRSVQQKMGTPSVLINNATYSTPTSIENINALEMDNHYKLNVKATSLLIVEFIKRFEFENGGRIVNLTSGQSLGKMPNEIAYAMTKSAIETLTQTLSSEIAAKGITINAVNPGPNDTGWMDDDLREEIKERFPTGRIGTPKDTANLIGFLVSEEGEWITGQVIHSEGGFRR
ncbi:SDR family oxidoreductase [bacterium SCSIO 12741]|nr:SDR family oxidoreductase [bacterium SCSIO 12741]